MRDLIYTGFLSLDGVADSPGGGPGEEHRSGGWVFKNLEFVPAAWSLKGEELAAQGGKSLSGRADRDKHMLTLRESQSYSNGILKLVYDVER